MKRSLSMWMLFLAALVVAAPLVHGLAGAVALRPTSRLWLTGKSTMHAFESEASRIQVTFEQDPAVAGDAASGAEKIEGLIRSKGVTSMNLVVAVKDLRSGKDGLDRNMYKALLAEQHPEINFRMGGYDVAAGDADGEMTLNAKGTLTVAGVDREMTVTGKAVREGDAIRLRGAVPLLMTQFGIKPPKMMLGALRTADEVVVHFDILIGSNDTEAPMSKVE